MISGPEAQENKSKAKSKLLELTRGLEDTGFNYDTCNMWWILVLLGNFNLTCRFIMCLMTNGPMQRGESFLDSVFSGIFLKETQTS